MKSKSIKLFDAWNQEVILNSLWKESQVTILCCRHLGSHTCKQVLTRLWETIPLKDRSLHRTIIIFGAGDRETERYWEERLKTKVQFLHDPHLESFGYFQLYSGLISIQAGGNVLRKLPLKLLQEIPPFGHSYIINSGT